MFRKEFIVLGLLASTIFLSVAGISAWITREVAHQAQMLASDTFPGLVYAGEAINTVDNNWEKILGLTSLPSAEARSNAVQQIQSHTTTEFWNKYRESIFDAEDAALFQVVLNSRSNSLHQAQQFFNMVNQQKLAEADKFLHEQFSPAFHEYRANAMKLFEMNREIGNKRAHRIDLLSHWLPAAAGVFSVLIFAVGFAFGLRGAFTGFELVFRRAVRKK